MKSLLSKTLVLALLFSGVPLLAITDVKQRITMELLNEEAREDAQIRYLIEVIRAKREMQMAEERSATFLDSAKKPFATFAHILQGAASYVKEQKVIAGILAIGAVVLIYQLCHLVKKNKKAAATPDNGNDC